METFEIVEDCICSKCQNDARELTRERTQFSFIGSVGYIPSEDWSRRWKRYEIIAKPQTCICLSVDYELVYLCKTHLLVAVALIDERGEK